MKVWFDTEFIEDGSTIELLSIGLIAEDGRTYYAESIDAVQHYPRASQWVKDNVIAKLKGMNTDEYVPELQTRAQIAASVCAFAGEQPEFWAYYADYDWVVLCQLFGTMMDLPKGWPMYCRDVKQLCDELGNPKLPEQTGGEHYALDDAIWARQAYEFLQIKKALAA